MQMPNSAADVVGSTRLTSQLVDHIASKAVGPSHGTVTHRTDLARVTAPEELPQGGAAMRDSYVETLSGIDSPNLIV